MPVKARSNARLAELREQIAPFKRERLTHYELIHRLKFEEVVAESGAGGTAPSRRKPETGGIARESGTGGTAAAPSATAVARLAREKAEAELAELQARVAPLQNEINQLTRQFWVGKDQVVAQNYDLSASGHRQVEQDVVYYEKPTVTLDRMRALEQAAESQVKALEQMLKAVG